jgi:hypothetical protein
MNDVHMNLYLDLDTVLELACIALALLASVAAACALRGASRMKARHAALEGRFAAVQSELDLVAANALRAVQSAQRMQLELTGLSDRLGLVELRSEARPFDQAIDSARRGADSATLTHHFGLSRGEADLVNRLHGRRKSA